MNRCKQVERLFDCEKRWREGAGVEDRWVMCCLIKVNRYTGGSTDRYTQVEKWKKGTDR